MSNLLLDAKAKEVTYEELREVPTPAATRTWTPLPHVELLDAVKREVTASGLTIEMETLALSQARNGAYGDRFFGLLEIRGDETYALELACRNSHDRSIPAGLCVGSRVLVCCNLSFSAEVVLARKHTCMIRRDLPRLIGSMVGRLGELRDQQGRRIEAYRNTAITDPQFHDLAIRAVDAGVVAASKLPRVLDGFRRSEHPEFEPRTVWSVFNSFTSVLKSYDLQDLPRRTQILHGLCDLLSRLN